MLFVLAGAIWLFTVISLVNTIKTRNVRPYFLSYAAVILCGFYGAVGFTNSFFPLLGTNLIEASLNGALYAGGLLVMFWGLSTFKQLHVEA